MTSPPGLYEFGRHCSTRNPHQRLAINACHRSTNGPPVPYTGVSAKCDKRLWQVLEQK